jgi:hypothetical protein
MVDIPWMHGKSNILSETATDYADTDSDSAVPDVHICASAA